MTFQEAKGKILWTLKIEESGKKLTGDQRNGESANKTVGQKIQQRKAVSRLCGDRGK